MTLLTATIGCQTDVQTSDGRSMPPDPRPAPAVPPTAQVNAMAVQVGAKPRDTDGNGFPDTLPVSIFLFAEPHPTPVHRPGSFEFALFESGESTAEAEPIARWVIPPPAVESGRMRSPLFGRGYQFELNLKDSGTDRYPAMAANLETHFHPAAEGAPPVRSSGVYTVRIGRTRTARP